MPLSIAEVGAIASPVVSLIGFAILSAYKAARERGTIDLSQQSLGAQITAVAVAHASTAVSSSAAQGRLEKSIDQLTAEVKTIAILPGVCDRHADRIRALEEVVKGDHSQTLRAHEKTITTLTATFERFATGPHPIIPALPPKD